MGTTTHCRAGRLGLSPKAHRGMLNMGFYQIRKLTVPRRPWKVQWIEYVGDKQKARDVPGTEWLRLGFYQEMTVEQACQRKDQLNALHTVKRVESKRTAIRDRLEGERVALEAFLNPIDVTDFERSVLFDQLFSGDNEAAQRNKIASHWRATQRLLVELKIEPQNFADRKKAFYHYFQKEVFSPSYMKKVLRIINQWGAFLMKRRGQYFEPIPFPRGFDKERIADTYLDASDGGRESAPLSPQALAKRKSALLPEHYAWLALSLWFGLRPWEVDNLKNPKHRRVETHEGKKVLFVFQTKLKSIAREKRWKWIPCLLPEQKETLKLIELAEFQRPLVKTVHLHFGAKVNLYGGRKGFEALMTSHGYRLEDVSLWLGHQSIEQTWRNYKSKQRVSLPRK